MIVAIDPGEHTGIVYVDGLTVQGVTIEGESRLAELWRLLIRLDPLAVIYEEFALRQSSAQHLVGNKFITCEVIGVLKLYCQMFSVNLVKLIPANKEFCGFSDSAKDKAYKVIDCGSQKITEHVRDAFRLLSYALLFKEDELHGKTSKTHSF